MILMIHDHDPHTDDDQLVKRGGAGVDQDAQPWRHHSPTWQARAVWTVVSYNLYRCIVVYWPRNWLV